MFVNTASPRRSFTIPISINLQGARRRQTRELLHTAQEQEWSCGVGGRGGQRARMPASSVGEDRAVLLGYAMMAFSVLMFFVVGFTVVKPYVNSDWEEEAGCVLLQADILEEWVDCRGVSTVPCLRVTVNLTSSNKRAFLHFDEESVLLAPQCFYVPKCQSDGAELLAEVRTLKNSLDAQLGSASSCFTDPTRHPGDVILSRKYTLKKGLSALLWPGLMLAGGALLVGLVKLTQRLAAAGRLTPTDTQGKLYRMLQPSGVQSPS